MPTLPAALAAALASDAARPFVTWLGRDGERTELSVRTFENNVAKAANLLQDEAAADDAARVVLLLPAHWQSAVWLGACAAVGTAAWPGGDPGDPSVVLAVVGPEPVETGAPLTLASSLHPLGMPYAGALPSGVLDAAVEVRAHGDRFSAYAPPTGATPWLVQDGDRIDHRAALVRGRDLGARCGAGTGARVLVLAAPEGVLDASAALALVAMPLALEGSVVLVVDPGADLERVRERERCDAVLDLRAG